MNRDRRKMEECSFGSTALVLVFIITIQTAVTSPVIRSSRMVREIYPELEQEIPDSSQIQVCIVGDVVYGAGETVPSEQPCLKCACAPPDVRCDTEICAPQPGCKAIHRSNRCCPDYQCECEHEGKIYGNGERLPRAPGGECLVCYCRGGEIQCADVGCYTRSDCEPRYIPGQCCPKYDHCPPRDHLADRLQYTTEASILSNIDPDIVASWPLSGVPINASENSAQPVTQDTVEEGSGEYEPPISAEEQTSSTPNTYMSDEPKQRPSTPITFSIKEIESKTNKRHDDRFKETAKVDKGTQTDSEGRLQITIQEVIPPRTEFKVTPQKDIPNKVVSISPINPATYKTQEALVSTVNPIQILTDNSNELSDVESYASEKTEVYDHPPPVLRIGDQLLFIRQGQLVPEKDASTPSPVITLIGAEGLQIGLGSGEFLDHEIVSMTNDESREKTRMNTPTDLSPKRLDETSSSGLDLSTKNSVDSSDIDLSSESTTQITSTKESGDTNETKSNSASEEDDSSNEYITVNTSNESDTQTDSVTTPKIVSKLEADSSLENQQFIPVTTSKPDEMSSSSIPVTTGSSLSSGSTLIKSDASSLTEIRSDNSEYMPEENPYYPPIPEDIMNLGHDESTTDTTSEPSVSISSSSADEVKSTASVSGLSTSNVDKAKSIVVTENISVIPLSTTDSTSTSEQEMKMTSVSSFETTKSPQQEEIEKTSKILPEILEIRSNKTVSTNKSSHPDWLKSEPTKIRIPLMKNQGRRIPLINDNAALPDSILSMTASSDMTSEDITDLPSSNVFTNTDETVSSKFSEVLSTENPFSSTKQDVETTENSGESTSEKSEKIIASGVVNPVDSKSKETVEVNDELFDSGESTTKTSQHISALSNEDASVETILNDSSPMDPSDLVEMVPGFETPTEHTITLHHSEERLENSDRIASPKDEVEMINENKDKIVSGEDSHVEVKETNLKDFHEEIQKRDVVKKVLKDTFENPKENIQTELAHQSTPTNLDLPVENNDDDDLNSVKPIDSHDLSTRSLNTSISMLNITKHTTDDSNLPEDTTKENEKIFVTNFGDGKETQVIQKVNTDNSKLNIQDSTGSIDTGALGVLRDFFKSQYRHYHDSRLTD